MDSWRYRERRGELNRRPEGSGSRLWYGHSGRQRGGQWEGAETKAAPDGSSRVVGWGVADEECTGERKEKK
jgi:hypothetical protein